MSRTLIAGLRKLFAIKGKIIGGSIVSPDAINLITQISLAIQNEMTAHDLAEISTTIFSWSEIIRVAAHKIK